MRCRCCGTIGTWSIPARDDIGCVCKKCYDFVNAPLRCPIENTINLCKSVITNSFKDYLYLRRYELSNQKLCPRRKREVLDNGRIARGFFGDLTGEFSKYCSIAGLIPEEAKERLKCLTLKKINDILGSLGKNIGTKK